MAYTSKNPRHSSVLTAPSGNTKDASAIIQADSTTQGIASPRMTETQRNAISTPLAGLQIFNTTTNEFNYYNGTNWVATSTAALETLVSELYVGTVGRSDYPDLDSAVGKVLASTDFDSQTDLFGWNNHDQSSWSDGDFVGGEALTQVGAITTVSDFDSNVIYAQFDGTNDALHTTGTSFDDTGSFTVGGMVKFDRTGTTEYIFSKYNSTNADKSFSFGHGSGGTELALHFYYDTSGTPVSLLVDDTSVTDSAWHSLVGVYNQEDVKLSIYVDGNLVGEKTDANLSARNNSITADFTIGALDGSSAVSSEFQGGITQVFYQKRALSQDEIRRIAHASTLFSHHGGAGHTLTATSFPRGAEGIWPLEVDANDVSGNSNNLADSSGSTVAYSGNNFNGVTGASEYDGTTDSLYDGTANFDDAGSFSVGAWVTLAQTGTSEIFISKYHASTTADQSWYLGHAGGGTNITFKMFDDTLAPYSVDVADSNAPIGVPTFIISRYTQEVNKLDLFINGVLVKSLVDSGLSTRNNTTSANFTVGAFNGSASATAATFHEGVISNAFYVKYALTDEEIAKLYSKKFTHHQSSGVYDLNMPMKLTKETGLIQKGTGENFERATDTTDVYADLSGLDSSDKVQIKLK